MTKDKVVNPLQESVSTNHRSLLCWKSAVAGLLISVMAFVMLAALGAGIAGITAEGLIAREESGMVLATGTGLYMGLSLLAALFCGSYFALRISRFVTTKVGAAHGLVIASAFFLLMLLGLGNAIGGVASAFGGFAKASTSGATGLGANPAVQDLINQALEGSTFKGEPREVAQGLLIRLLQGDSDSAKNYLAYQTGQSKEEVDSKIVQLKNQFDSKAKIAAEKTARAMGNTGITLFILFLVGLIAAVMGGRTGANANVEHPFANSPGQTPMAFTTLQTQRGNVVPYIFGWLLGVPLSILLLIAMLRTVF